MVTSVSLGHRCTSKLRPEYQDGIFEHISLLQIGDQSRDPLVDFFRRSFRVCLHRSMVIPIAMVELNESYAAFGKPTRQKAVRRERSISTLRTIQVEYMLRLFGNIHQFRHAGLHSESKLVLFDASGDLWIIESTVRYSIQRSDRVDDLSLLTSGNSLRIANIQHRIPCASKFNTLILPRQESRVPLSRCNRLPLPILARRNHHDETRQILRFIP